MPETKSEIQKKEYPLQYIKGIGPRRAEALAEMGIESLEDLVTFFPRKYIDARKVIQLSEAKNYLWQSVTVHGKVLSVKHFPHPRPGRTTISVIDDSGGILQLVYFSYADWISKQYKQDDEIVAIGYINIFRSEAQIVHPEFLEKITDENAIPEGKMLPIYPSSQIFKEAHISQIATRKMIESALATDDFKKVIRETLPDSLRNERRLASRPEAIREIHSPASPEAYEHCLTALKYEELFFLQLRFAIERQRMLAMAKRGIAYDISSLSGALTGQKSESLIHKVLTSLAFQLTKAQFRVLQEIAEDMAKTGEKKIPMHRLVQGDVGSGKTIVALLAMLVAVENGYQAALMAPTEVLAKQHYLSISEMLKGLPIEVSLLVGGQGKKLRTQILTELAEGRTHIVIGTHALIEDNVKFDKLGIVVADEQHKFGVAQRKALVEKHAGSPPDVLIMSATPIPRTLALTLYQDLDVSTIDELPAGRKQILTRIVFPNEQRQLFQHIRETVVKRKEQVYIVYPQLEKSETKDVKTAVHSYEIFKEKIFPDLKVGLIHGKLKSDEKQAVMAAFRNREIDILVSTSVIEVGIDVANATLMIIGNAERFGLAQLHQLRGRVGRGGKASECILVPSDKLTPDPQQTLTSEAIEERTIALERLHVLERTTDGFEIARADLKFRGPGDFLGTQQSGVLKLKIADLTLDDKLLEQAATDVKTLTTNDPQLRKKENLATRQELLRLYQQKESFLEVG
ncbi:MAG: ATP-dependent DNA helicase RecG [Candidatus Kapaibacterium sp.]